MKIASRVLVPAVVLAMSAALGANAASAAEKDKDAPVVRKEVDVRRSETQVVKTAEEVRKNEAEIEARLEAARARLEAAAREVAELSSELTGPVMHDFVMRRGRPRAILGINIGDSESKEGVAIDSVSPGGAAGKAGLKAGDVIVSLDGKALVAGNGGRSPAHALIRHMRTVEPGTKVQVEFLREGKKQKAEVRTEEFNMERFAYAPHARAFMKATPATPPVPGVAVIPPHAEGSVAFHRFPGHGMLDMELVTLTPKLGSYFGADEGVLVVRAPKEGDLKLEEGDVILDIDGRQPQSGVHALRILRSYQPGEKLSVNVLRNRKKVKLDVTVPKGERLSWTLPRFEDDVMEEVIRELDGVVPSAVEQAVRPFAPPEPPVPDGI